MSCQDAAAAKVCPAAQGRPPRFRVRGGARRGRPARKGARKTFSCRARARRDAPAARHGAPPAAKARIPYQASVPRRGGTSRYVPRTYLHGTGGAPYLPHRHLDGCLDVGIPAARQGAPPAAKGRMPFGCLDFPWRCPPLQGVATVNARTQEAIEAHVRELGVP